MFLIFFLIFFNQSLISGQLLNYSVVTSDITLEKDALNWLILV